MVDRCRIGFEGNQILGIGISPPNAAKLFLSVGVSTITTRVKRHPVNKVVLGITMPYIGEVQSGWYSVCFLKQDRLISPRTGYSLSDGVVSYPVMMHCPLPRDVRYPNSILHSLLTMPYSTLFALNSPSVPPSTTSGRVPVPNPYELVSRGVR